MAEARKVFIKTYGCQMNVYDSGRMADILAAEGFRRPERPEDADLVLLNTCHIREKAAEKVYSEVGRLRALKQAARAEGRAMKIAVAGCVAQAEGAEILKRAQAVDVVVGPQTYHHLPALLAAGKRAVDTEFPAESKFEKIESLALPVGAQLAPSEPTSGERVPHRAGRLRPVLHLLRRALYARRGIFAPGREDRRRSGGARRARREGGHAARAERQRVSTAKARTDQSGRSQSCSRGCRRSRASSGCATRPAIRAT